MEQKHLNTFFVIVSAVASVVFTVVTLTDRVTQKKVEKIRFDKNEIVRIDSLLDAREKKVLDSLTVVINSLRSQDARLNDFNFKIRKQNEKLDHIYSSIHIDRPDF
jgi:hypothetical protein